MSPERFISVAVPVPGLGVLTYRLPPPLPTPPKGARVVVPLGRRNVVGCVVEGLGATTTVDAAAVRDVVDVLDRDAFLPEHVVDLALWVADYYACGPGDVLLMAMPPLARRGDPTPFRTVTMATLTAEGVSQGTTVRGAKQRMLLDRLSQQPQPVLVSVLTAEGLSSAVVRRAAELGLVQLTTSIEERDPFAGTAGNNWAVASTHASDRPLTHEQTLALRTLTEAADARAFRPVLLHGVTGSGKTEVYLRLARHVLGRSQRVLVLVPEISLTPALTGLFRAAFGERVAIQHSGLSDGERHDQWYRIRRGEVDVVVGTRSAVFAPLDRLGLIIVDEEHEASYKQEETPRYHGRDVAVMRGRMERAMVVLGSATPSLESAANVEAGRYAIVTMKARVLDRPLARVRIVDMRTEIAEAGVERALSAPLVEAIGARLAAGEQSLVLLNRRGFATVVFCRQCGASLECPHCSVTLTFHRAARRVRCHYCNYSAAVPRACGECGGQFLEQSGVGTERLEAEVRERFPAARITRVDRDTIRRKGAITRIIDAVGRREIDVVVGTQMIAKGHDFPAVTLVGVVNADVGLGHADFRAGERTFQLLTQVVGRAGRGERPGEAIIQTLYPNHYSVQAAAAQDYERFRAQEVMFRRAMRYPPTTGLVSVVVRDAQLERAMAAAQDLAKRVRARGGPMTLLGPAPSALARIKDEYRVQFFLKGRDRRPMREAVLAALADRPDLKRRTTIDVDPMSVT